MFYHIIINYSNDKEGIGLDFSEEKLLSQVIHPYEKGEPIFINGKIIRCENLENIKITKSAKSVIATKESSFIDYVDKECVDFEGNENVTDEFIKGGPGYKKIVENTQKSNEIFIVHGHDNETKETVARFVSNLNLNPIILHERPNEGKTIIEKFEDSSSVGFAIILLTPDDVCTSQVNRVKESRARQNVIFELGYFIGKIGRKRVCALYKGDVEVPSDYKGVIYIEMDSKGGWKLEVAKEIKKAGISVDLNLIK